MKCKETVPLRREFVKQMLKELNINCPHNIEKEEILAIVEDILIYLEDRNSDNYKTNQGILGIRNLFRGYIVKVWKGANFAQDKYHKLNKIVVRLCI